MQIVSVKVSTIVHATEDREKVIHALSEMCGMKLSPSLAEQRAVKGHFGNPIIPLTIGFLASQAETVFVNVWRRFSRQERNSLVEGLADRLDDGGRLHLRLDKQEGFRGKVRLSDGDPIGVQFSLQRGFTHFELRNFLESMSR